MLRVFVKVTMPGEKSWRQRDGTLGLYRLIGALCQIQRASIVGFLLLAGVRPCVEQTWDHIRAVQRRVSSSGAGS